jgi:ABC-type Fe3+-hydroxamate transport system substrate-binding protein
VLAVAAAVNAAATGAAPDGLLDDRGDPVGVRGPVRRVVSLVPSLTEALEMTAPGIVVGATDWCTHPADLSVTRVGGTKNPDVAAIRDLAPDLVVANVEENRAPDLAVLREAGLAVWVTDVETVPGALVSLDRLLAGCGLDRPAWLDAAAAAWAEPQVLAPRRRAVVPVWRKPWMALGRDTFAGDVLARLGVDNVLAGHPERYPRIDLAGLPPYDLAVLPDEPYRFTADDGPQFFPSTPCALVSGRHLTWYGPSMAEAPSALLQALARTPSAPGSP